MNFHCIFAVPIAEIAQLVERNLAKVEVAGPNPVFRSNRKPGAIAPGFFVANRRELALVRLGNGKAQAA